MWVRALRTEWRLMGTQHALPPETAGVGCAERPGQPGHRELRVTPAVSHFLLLAALLEAQEGRAAGFIQGWDFDRAGDERTEGQGFGGPLQDSDQNDSCQLNWAGRKQRCGLPRGPMKRCKHTALPPFTTQGHQCPCARRQPPFARWFLSLEPEVMMDDGGWVERGLKRVSYYLLNYPVYSMGSPAFPAY